MKREVLELGGHFFSWWLYNLLRCDEGMVVQKKKIFTLGGRAEEFGGKHHSIYNILSNGLVKKQRPRVRV